MHIQLIKAIGSDIRQTDESLYLTAADEIAPSIFASLPETIITAFLEQEQSIRESFNYGRINRVKAGCLYEKLSLDWLNAIKELPSDARAILFIAKVVELHGRATTHFYQDITDKKAEGRLLALSTIEKYLRLFAYYCLLRHAGKYPLDNIAKYIKTINGILIDTFGGDTAGKLVLVITEEAKQSSYPDEVIDIFQDLAFAAFKQDALEAQKPSYDSLSYYRQYLMDTWLQTKLVSEPDDDPWSQNYYPWSQSGFAEDDSAHSSDEADSTYSQDGSIGDQIEEFSAREMQLVEEKGYTFPHIAYAGDPNTTHEVTDLQSDKKVPPNKLKYQ